VSVSNGGNGRLGSGEPGHSLVLDGQRSAAGFGRRCPDAPRNLRLVGPDGLSVLSCKRRTCLVCGPRRARELARVLVIDARVEAPTVAMTLTTARPNTTSSEYRRACATLWKHLRREWGRAEYYAAVEFTTGLAERSGGHRRLHAHHLVKGLPVERVLAVEAVCREVMGRALAAPKVEVAALRSPGAAIGYLGLHHRKPQQAPPVGWRGMVERHSQEYFHRPIGELREQARRELRAEAVQWSHGLPPEVAALAVELEAIRWAEHRARVVRVRTRGTAGLLEPMGEVETGKPRCRSIGLQESEGSGCDPPAAH
jgi:hypothetical protein